jgi:hypothetical protein
LAGDRTLIQIRERSFLDLLDLALVVVRRRPLTLGLAALAGVAPCAAINAYLTSDPEFNPFLYIVLLIVEAPWATAPLTIVLGSLMFGERPRPLGVLKVLGRGLPSMIVHQLILRGILGFFIILYPLIPSRLAFLDEVILLERGKLFSAVRRSSTLCGARGGEFFGQWLAQMAFGVLFVGCFWFGTGALFSAQVTSEVTCEQPDVGSLYGFRCQLAIWLEITFFGVARFLTYIDQRIRLEGWEVKHRLQACCLLYTNPSPRDGATSRMASCA